MVISAVERSIWLHEISAQLQQYEKDHKPAQIALILVALDNLKQLGALYGQSCVDTLLHEVTRRLNEAANHDAQLIHWMSDEFVMKCDVVDEAQLQSCIDAIHAILKLPFDYQQQSIVIATSLGWSILPVDSQDPEQAIQQASVAQLLAKAHRNPDGCRYQADAACVRLYHEMILDHDLKFALCDQQFELLYQPKYNHAQHIVGAEALIRWHHPRLGLLSAQQFIEHAEQSGAIVKIGDWVLNQVMQHLVELKQLHPCSLPIAINLSALQFEQIGFLERFKFLLDYYHLPADLMTLEITEYRALQPGGLGIEVVKAIQALGVQISLDDFGLEHSNFSYFTLLDIDEIKIDKLFTDKIESDKTKQIIVKTILDFAAQLNIQTVVEGIETAEQVKIAIELGASQLQGFYYGQPLTLNELQHVLSAQSATPLPPLKSVINL